MMNNPNQLNLCCGKDFKQKNTPNNRIYSEPLNVKTK